MPQTPLAIVHPLIEQWFADRVGKPTEVQARAWPEIAAGRHVLVTAPTGSGKTLTAFLWALDRLITGVWPRGQVRVLYVSPLKALNNDIERNLLEPLVQLQSLFVKQGKPFPVIGVQTRSGDTSQSDRRRMLRHPPEILITTPESLNLLLSSKGALHLFTGIKTVILDEIHAVAATKRGTHLITAVDRIVPMAGEFQRLALSATVKPLEAIAEFVGGYVLDRDNGEARYTPRPVSIVEAPGAKALDVRVRYPGRAEDTSSDASRWAPIVDACRDIIGGNQSTLLFVNSRRLCERVALFINDAADRLLAYSHHGSLSREMRSVVEQRLKQGDLAAIVATSSLELGIDIGALDEVVLIQTPFSIASALQRIGRAGHQVGAVSRGALFPTHGRDFLDAAVLARAVMQRDIEPLRPITGPLDVLGQVVVSMTGVAPWDVDALFDAVRTSTPYRNLTRRQFDLVLDMLAGRYAETRIRALSPVVAIDRIDNTVRGTGAGLRSVRMSGGTIPDRGYYTLRHSGTHARIGDLDEEFVWEAAVGDGFTLGSQCWRVEKITHNEVLVSPSRPGPSDTPFWKAEELNRGFHLSERIGEFLESAEEALGSPEFAAALRQDCCMEPDAAGALIEFLEAQRTATGAPLPHRHHLLVEWVENHGEEPGAAQAILHTLWGGALNRPYAMALAQAWEERYGHRIEMFANDDCIALMAPHPVDADELLGLVSPEGLESLLRKRLEQSGYFGARFRENAGTALLLPRTTYKGRMPLWLNRLRSKKLLDAVMGYDDFPILAETWRTCLQDGFDLDNLKAMLGELRDGLIQVTQARTAVASPFAASMTWRQTNEYMYQDDTPTSGKASRLSADLLAEVVHTSELRPRIPRNIIERFRQKAQRVYPGYAPATGADLLEWVKERLLILGSEWDELLAAVQRDHGISEAVLLESVGTKLAWVNSDGLGEAAVVAVECLPRLMAACECTMEDLEAEAVYPLGSELAAVSPTPTDDGEPAGMLEPWLAEWMRFYGPMPRDTEGSLLPAPDAALDEALENLADDRLVVVDHLSDGAKDLEVCDAENLEILLRLTRAAARPAFEALPIADLPLFMATFQGLVEKRPGRDGLERALESLLACPLNAALVESDILPARVGGYAPAMLDDLMRDSGLLWAGREKGKIVFGFADDLDLCGEGESGEEIGGVLPSETGRFDFTGLLDHTDLDSAALTRALWDNVWTGRITNDTFAALRKGIETKFRPAKLEQTRRRPGRGAFNRWKATRPFAGNWFALPAPEPACDALDEAERNKDRVRLLLGRYGILFRELLERELPTFRWGALFRTLRLMELSGEVMGGCFFDGIPGLQFISQPAFRILRRGLPRDTVVWMNATDPASLCGVGLESLKGALPRRAASTYLVFQGSDVMMTVLRKGRELDIRVEPDDPALPRYLDLIDHLLKRPFQSLSSLTVEIINGESATKSPYLPALGNRFDVATGPKDVTLRRK
jgi:ATP-dependent helicase Lhr and Lhr-like helicase